ncbi:hypothetical protein GCM10027589_07360 [Actinocorallia lasiicapitis]
MRTWRGIWRSVWTGRSPRTPRSGSGCWPTSACAAAVNDPATAVQGLDHIAVLLLRFADRELDLGTVRDADGAVRLIVPVPGWDGYLSVALDEAIGDAARSPGHGPAVRRTAVALCLGRLRRIASG